jgi:putative lysine transport system permease protein
MKKILMLIFFGLVFLSGCGKKVEFDFNKKQLVVGLEAAYAPFNWMETSATDTNHPLDGMNAFVEGYDVQIAKLIAKDLGMNLIIKRIEWKGLIPALESGMIDVIIAGMSPTEDRKLSINFTDTYYESEHVVIVKKDGAYANASDLTDFNGAKIVGQKATIYDELAGQLQAKNTGSVHQTPLESIPEIVNAIKSGVSDVTIVEKPVAVSIVNNNDTLKYIKPNTAFTLDATDTIVAIGLRKIDTLLLQKLNESLAKITHEQREALMMAASNHAPGE